MFLIGHLYSDLMGCTSLRKTNKNISSLSIEKVNKLVGKINEVVSQTSMSSEYKMTYLQ